MFIPGETLIHVFVIPFNYLELQQVVVSYKQDDRIVFEKVVTKNTPGATMEKQDEYTKVTVEFTQAESLSFANDKPYYIQLNVYNRSHSRMTSKEIKASNGIQFVRAPLPKAGE